MSTNGCLTVVPIHVAFPDASGVRGQHNEFLGQNLSVVAPPNPRRGLSAGDGGYIHAVINEINGPVPSLIPLDLTTPTP
jgi:hypothetical protein